HWRGASGADALVATGRIRNAVRFSPAVPLYWKTPQRRAGLVDNPSQTVVRCLRSFFAPGQPDGVRDSELLRQFVATRGEGAFAGLVQRHGPMVLGLARRVLRDH